METGFAAPREQDPEALNRQPDSHLDISIRRQLKLVSIAPVRAVGNTPGSALPFAD
jgi:hypothetical protein